MAVLEGTTKVKVRPKAQEIPFSFPNGLHTLVIYVGSHLGGPAHILHNGWVVRHKIVSTTGPASKWASYSLVKGRLLWP